MGGLDPGSCGAGQVKTIYRNSDGFINIQAVFSQYPLQPFDFSGATEIKVSMLNGDQTVLTLKLSLSQVQIFKAQAGQIRAFYNKSQSVLLALGLQDVQIVATVSSQDTIMVASEAVNVLPERYPGV